MAIFLQKIRVDQIPHDFESVSKVIVAEAPVYDGFLAERLAPIVLAAQEQFKFSHILAGSSAIRDTIQ